MTFRKSLLALGFIAVLPVSAAMADADVPQSVTLKDHHFIPETVTIPADTRVELLVTNQDMTPAEFESDDFKAEKVLPPGHEVKIGIGPLKPGTYEFHDEYNEDVSKSHLIVQ